MQRSRTYLDYNATAPLRPEVRAAVAAQLDRAGNPSSVHAEGRAARAMLEEARLSVARAFGTEPKCVTFASGGTEALNTVLTPALSDGRAPLGQLLVSSGEHPAVLDGHRFGPDKVRMIPLRPSGLADLDALAALLAGGGPRPLVALQIANNETGVIQPVRAAADLVHAAGGLLVCDAVQGAGRLDCDLKGLGADALVISAHKMGGLKGVGALAFAAPRLHMEGALIRGGGQERGTRSGTENVTGIVAMAAALEASLAGRDAEQARLRELRDGMEAGLADAFPDLVIFGREVERVANTSAFAVPGLGAETLLIALDLAGFAVSSGSACSSGKVKPSHVLAAMGVVPDLARGALRISLGWATVQEDVERFCETFQKTVRNMRLRRAVPAAE
jgi:cysteine desulfurase